MSIFNENGTMVATTKSNTVHKLEELIPEGKITSLNKHVDAIIFYSYAVIQSLPPPATTLRTTFKDMAHSFCTLFILL